MTAPRSALVALLMLIALAHGLIYALGVPLWQAPDEPMLFEYAGLTAELGRIPTSADRSPALEQRIAESLSRAQFYQRTMGATPAIAPATLDAARAIFSMPRQVGGDPPLYFALAAIPLRLTPGWSIEAQLTMLRLLNALLLPLVVACVYLAAERIGSAGEPRSTRSGASSRTGFVPLVAFVVQTRKPFTPPHPISLFPVAAASLVALQPMFAYIGAAMNNDGLASAIGALLCLLLVRMVGQGLPGRELLLFGALALLGLAVKRTSLPFMLMAGLLALLWVIRVALRGGPGAARRRATALGLAVGLPALSAGWLAGQHAWGQAARWYDAASLAPAPRVATASGFALVLAAGEERVQALPDVATVHLRNNTLRAGARIWSDGPATGRLVLYAGDRRQEQAFSLRGEAAPELGAAVPAYAQGVRLGIIADSGQLYVGEIWARGVGLAGNLVANGDLARPALRPDSPLQLLVRYLRVDDLLWVIASDRLQWGLPLGDWFSWLFASFWGQFGWFSIALVRGSPWAWLIGAQCAAGLVGALVALVRARGARRAQIAALLVLVGLALIPLLLNALIDFYPIQQGRYLFPVLPAIALLIALGQATLVPMRWHMPWLLLWLSFWLALAAAALLLLAQRYAL